MAPARSAQLPPQPGRQDVKQQVVDWRLHVLVAAGYPDEIAERIAQSDADLHRACDMIDGGCAPDLAERILT